MITPKFLHKFFMDRFEKTLEEKIPKWDGEDVFKRMRENFGDENIAIVGGSIRDFFFGYEPNDFDVIIKDEGYKEGYEEYGLDPFMTDIFGSDLNHSRNAFGGHTIKFDSGVSYDLWNLKDTWGIREGYVDKEGFFSYTQCCAYDTDAGYICPFKEDEYHLDYIVNSINNEEIGLIFGVSPIPMKTAIKAYRLKHKYNLEFSEEVGKFIKRAVEQNQ